VKKVLIIILILVAVPLAYWTISPLFITKTVNETAEEIPVSNYSGPTDEQHPQTISSGTFEGLGGHNASGKALLIKSGDKYYVRLDDDFKVTNGPDLFVHFGSNGEYAPEARLGTLKGNVGGQNYEVPTGINPSNYNEVWIWCRSFSVAFGKATFN